ncbi:MAG: family 16 glycosylhydrolase [Lentisphaeria bacterium]
MKKSATPLFTALSLMLIAAAAPAADQPATTQPMEGATAVTSEAFEAAGTGAVQTPSGIDLKGYKLVFADEFDAVSWTDKSPKGSAKWFSRPSIPGKYIGFQVHDEESMVIKDGILINTLSVKMKTDVQGSRCGGPAGMKTDTGTEVVSVDKVGQAKKADKRFVWNNSGWVGMKFTTPAAGLTVSQLGRYNIEGNVGAYSVRIFDADGGDDVAKATVKFKDQPAGLVYEPVVGGNVTLKGNHTYYLMTETVGWDKKRNGYINEKWYNGDTTVTASEGITVHESAWGNWHAGSLFSIDPTRKGFMQQYGYWEARVKLPAGGVGVWPSWCLYTTIGGENEGLNEEVDIFEHYGAAYDADKDGGFGMRNGNWGKGPKEGHANVWPLVSKPWLNWHVYGFLATPTKCAFYMDGKQVGEFDTPTSYLTKPMYMTLEYNNGGFWPLSGLIANSHMDVDWVRVWAPPPSK